jgi:hypothetical protein
MLSSCSAGTTLNLNLGVVAPETACAIDSATQEAESGGLCVRGHPGKHSQTPISKKRKNLPGGSTFSHQSTASLSGTPFMGLPP